MEKIKPSIQANGFRKTNLISNYSETFVLSILTNDLVGIRINAILSSLFP